MEYKGFVQKVAAEISRVLLGVVFIFSGTVKAIDPMGGEIKIGDYLTAFNLDFLQSFSVFASFNLSALELTLGVCMLLGVYRKYTSFLTLLMMLFMTPLTLYLALFNPVSDCGCFGDALVLSNWETFYKNIVLLAAAICAFKYNQRLLNGFTYRAYWFVALWSYAFAIGFAYRNYNHLPIVDFRPYQIGANIPKLMEIPEGAPVDEYKYSFIYEKDGVQKEFTLDNAPADDSTWVFIDSKTELIKKGFEPVVSSFHIYNLEDEDITDDILYNPNPLLLLIAPHVEKAEDDRIDEINNAYDYALENGLDFYCITGSSSEDIIRWSENTGAEYPFLMADDVLLKTIVRSNPGLVLMREGTILMKWHYNDIPQEEELKSVLNGYLIGNTDEEAKEDGRLITNILTFAVPLSLVWCYDFWRNRRRRKSEASK